MPATPSSFRIPELTGTAIELLLIKSTGRGTRKRTRLTPQGFHRLNEKGELGVLSRAKAHFGFHTGDIVCANVTAVKLKGSSHSRVAGYLGI